MRFARIAGGDGGRLVVLVQEDRAVAVDDLVPGVRSLGEVIAGGTPLWDEIRGKMAGREGEPFDSTALGAPLDPVRNVFCVGRNYRDHALEAVRSGVADRVQDEAPIFFTKATTTINGPFGAIPAYGHTAALDYEAELGVIIGRAGRDIPPEEAKSFIFGYTLLNDVSARDLQTRHQQWFLGKSLDGFCPLGPSVVTSDEIAWPVEETIRCRVNGELRQELNTRDMIFDIPAILSELSRGMTLLPGDLIATGTGDGVGRSFRPPRYLRPGDRVEIASAALGRMENVVGPDPAR